MRLLIFLILISFSCIGQKKNNEMEHIDIVKSFLNSVIESISDEDIAKKYLTLSDSSSQIKEYVSMQLNALRKRLKDKHQSDFIYSHYNSNLNSDLMVSRDKEENVLIVYYQGQMLIPVLVEESKIKSFSVMNKGGKKIFLLL